MLGRIQKGFTLTEVAIVLFIVGLLIGGAMMTFSAQVEQRTHNEAVRRLNSAADAVIAFAIVNRRLPCPAVNAGGDEVLTTGTALTGGACTNTSPYGGYLPARSIGFSPIDADGYGMDPWNNRIRYAVARTINDATCNLTTTPLTPHFTSMNNLRSNGVSCKPSDLDICVTATGTNTTCNTATRATAQETVAFVVYTLGANGAPPLIATYGADEAENVDGNDGVFVSRIPSAKDAAAATYFDDLMVFVPAGVLYSRLISAGVLP